MINKFALIIRKIFYFLVFILLACFMVTNTEKVEVQVIPFYYKAEIRSYLLVLTSFLLGILCCKITSFFKKLSELLTRIKNFILRRKTNIVALISILNVFFLSLNSRAIANNSNSIFVNKSKQQISNNNQNKKSIFKKKSENDNVNKKGLFSSKQNKIIQEKPLSIQDNTIIYSKIKNKNNKKDLKTLMSLVKAKNKNKNLYDLKTEFAMVYNNDLYTINKKTKTIKNKKLSTKITSKISFDSSYLYFITANNNLYFLNRNNFNIDFIYYETAETTVINNLAPVIYDDYIIALFNGNKLVILNKSNGLVVAEQFLQKNKIINESDIMVVNNSVKIGDTIIDF